MAATGGPALGLFWAYGRRGVILEFGSPALGPVSARPADVGAGSAPIRTCGFAWALDGRPVPMGAAGRQVGVVRLEQLAGGQFGFAEARALELGHEVAVGAPPGGGFGSLPAR